MLLIREVMCCRPGRVRPMVGKFVARSKLDERTGLGKMRVMKELEGLKRYHDLVEYGQREIYRIEE